MADCRNRLFRLNELPNELDRSRHKTKRVGIDDAAWQYQTVEIVWICTIQWRVDRHFGRFIVMLKGLDLPFLVGNDGHSSAGFLQSLDRLGELHLFAAIGCQDGEAATSGFSCHDGFLSKRSTTHRVQRDENPVVPPARRSVR